MLRINRGILLSPKVAMGLLLSALLAGEPGSFVARVAAQAGPETTPASNPKKKEKAADPANQPASTPDADTPPPTTSQPAKKTLKEQGRELFGGGGTEVAPDGTPTGGWVIMLETFTGSKAALVAAARVDEVKTLLGRTDIRVEARDKGSAVVMGSYTGPQDPKAKKDLEFLRSFVSGGVRPYDRAFMLPTNTHDAGQMPELDLGSVRAKYGKQNLYSLQIAVYETPDKPDDAKRAAEKAAKVLRDAGEKAFYYHSPARSMVTIGVFTSKDVDEATGRPKNPEIARLQGKYPLNLLDGQYPIKMPGGKEQASALVRVP